MAQFSINKLNQLKIANDKLCIYDDMSIERNKNLVFIHTPPKVGSTTIVSTIRLYAMDKYTVLHIHDEKSLKIMCNIDNISINEIIRYNQYLGKNVFVIDVYRSPIEQKISDFFEGICIHHFNNTPENINKYDVQKVIQRFNNLFPHLSNNDYFKEKYDISQHIPSTFDFEKKYLSININNITYIKLRLKDADIWNSLLSTILNIQIPKIVTDYETANKPIKDIYNLFKQTYKIPNNLLEIIKSSPQLNYYYSSQERNEYINSWTSKSIVTPHMPYTVNEFNLYSSISKENQHINEIQYNHYMDMGCKCIACSIKRTKMIENVNNGGKFEKITHNEAKMEHLSNKVAFVNKLIQSATPNIKFGRPKLGLKRANKINTNIINNNSSFIIKKN